MKLYRGNIGDFTGGIFASWFMTGVKGPMAFATGFVEMPCAPWSLFYRWMSPFGGRTYLGAAVDQETSAASGDFGEVFFNFMLVVNNHLASKGNDQPFFFGEAPAFVRTNGNPAVDAAMRSLIGRSPNLLGTDWERELRLREIGNAYRFGSGSGKISAPDAPFTRWWTLVTDKEYVDAAFIQFVEAWAGAACVTRGKRQSSRRSPQRGLVSYSEFTRFFDNFHMPLLPPEVGLK
jgi:hypothetical protein